MPFNPPTPYYQGVQFAGGGGFGTPALSQFNQQFGSGSLNPTARSFGTNNVTGFPIPDLSYADPQKFQRLGLAISDLVYVPGGGGYRYRDDHYTGNFGSNPNYVDPRANQAAKAYYNYIGSLPTRPVGTPALNQFYQNFGGGYSQGPSFNSMFANLFQNASPFMQQQYRGAGFGSTFQGPYRIGSGY